MRIRACCTSAVVATLTFAFLIDVGKDDRATFVTDLVNASNGETVGAIRIPLEID